MKFTPPVEVEAVVTAFAPLFSRPTWERVQVLLCGALLSPASTLTAALRALGLGGDEHFANFHRVLNRAQWSAFQAASKLLLLLVEAFVAAGAPLILTIDDTVERRWGRKIKARAIYRDPRRSSRTCFQKTSGLRWISVHLAVTIPWAQRVWALPVLTALAPSERYEPYLEKGRKYKHLPRRARGLMGAIWRWAAPLKRPVIFVADKTYASMELLAWAVRVSADHLERPLSIVTRLRLDARLFEEPPPRQPGRRGRNKLTGARQPNLAARLVDEATRWQKKTVAWYGSEGSAEREVEFCSGEALWYHPGVAPVPIRWVLIRDPQGRFDPLALMSTDRGLAPGRIVELYVQRWPAEVTFEETNKHLGLSGQRQWSDKAIERTTPVRLALFSLVALIAERLHRSGRPIQARCAAWYPKSVPTFSDALAAVRGLLWEQGNFCRSLCGPDLQKTQAELIAHMAKMLCHGP
jgi:hypothetical protein